MGGGTAVLLIASCLWQVFRNGHPAAQFVPMLIFSSIYLRTNARVILCGAWHKPGIWARSALTAKRMVGTEPDEFIPLHAQRALSATATAPAIYRRLTNPEHTVAVAAADGHRYSDLGVVSTSGRVDVAPVELLSTPMSGTVTQGHRLSAGQRLWSNASTGYSYRWKQRDCGANTCSARPGAATPTYSLGARGDGWTILSLDTPVTLAA